jgi:multidrug resistance efflux pump
LVKAGEVVVQFDTTQQEYNLKEAESDLAETEQQVIQAEAAAEAAAEEARYRLLSAQADLQIAELEMRKNPIVPAIQARQNELALQAAQNRQRQAGEDLKNGQATAAAAIAIQRAGLNKAKVMAETAQRAIDSMTLRVKSSGYVNVQQNTKLNILYWGMQLPPFQVGDTVRAGMAVAQIPDLKNWDVSAAVGELDRGHLSVGQKVAVSVVALAGRAFAGHVKNIGGTTGPPWGSPLRMPHRAGSSRPGSAAGHDFESHDHGRNLGWSALGPLPGVVRK